MSTKIKFGTDGWRAIIAEDFTFENVIIVSNALGQYLIKNYNKDLPILIGYDTRFLADRFAKVCALELSKLGLTAKISETPLPTPVIAFAATQSKTCGAVQFTASHNPPEYCGLKYITHYGGPAPVEVTKEITSYLSYSASTQLDSEENILNFNPKDSYISHLKKLIDFNTIKKANLKIIYDPMFGAGNGYLDFILNLAEVDVKTIHNKKDPLFGGLLPEPRNEFLTDLKKAVTESNYDLGLATDGDADRLGAIDKDGSFFSPNKIASMLLRHLVKNKKLRGNVVRTLSTTHLMDHLAKKYDLKLIETKVGFKWICEEMKKGNVLIGAEESGGISILNHVPDKDAILAGILLVEMIAYEKKSLNEIYSDTVKEAGWSCINDKLDLHMNEKQKDYFISTLGKITEYDNLDKEIDSINKVEGVKYIFKDGSWFMARASGTEPMARVYYEAISEEALEKMKKTINKIVEATCQK